MLGKGPTTATIAHGEVSDRPHIAARDGNDPIQIVPVRTRIWARNDAPLCAIPMFNENKCAGSRHVGPNSPHIVAGDSSDTCQVAGPSVWMRARNGTPLRAVPMLNQCLRWRTAVGSAGSYRPGIAGSDRGYRLQMIVT